MAKRRQRRRKHNQAFTGIRGRWMKNSVLVVLAIVLVAVLALTFTSASSCYASMRSGLESRAKTASDFMSNYLSQTYTEYYQSAYVYTESFQERDELELQFLNAQGQVLISTYGITSGTSPKTTDIVDALETGEISSWMGRNPQTGERIMAVSCPLIYSDGQVIGLMRYVTSLKLADQRVLLFALTALAVGAVVMLIVLLSNAYFIKSIVEPVQEITGMVQRIADGGYGIQIERTYDDEIGKMVDMINEMSMKINQSEKMKTEFISSVSHELRTPLTAITGWGETLLYDQEITGDARRGISIILKEARRLTKMVEELLEFTRIEDGRFTLNITQVDIAAELEDSIFTYGELLRQEDILLEYNPCDEELPIIPGDPERLKQVFLNILDNANKYGREGKRIVVSTGLEHPPEGDYVRITIRDFGQGIPEDELPHVKMKFYKGSSKERGSGIGLAVCEEIVRLHNGTLDIENAEGGGVRVTVRLQTLNQKA